MSFSTEVKNELCRVSMQRVCCTRAEAYGALLHASAFSHKEIRLNTENAAVARRLQALLQRAFFVVCEPQRVGQKHQLILTGAEQIGRIFDALGYDRKSHITYHLNRNVLEEDCCIASFLRGAFLMAGTVAGPDKKSHLELKTARQSLAGEETSLLLDLGLSPKQMRRASAHILYFKDGTSVEDFLTRIGAPRAAMELMEAKVEKNIRNTINRQVNCETANLVKAADASARQIAAIRAVLDAHGEEGFPENLRETVRLRLEYPTDSLAELAQRFDPPISKPGLSHRLKKIIELASKEN
ncbi:MAG TPA: DNA-binding protein WhiA [Candidatus Agathobaculum intestinigallinarum]|nr:DNA-binding protein WhiA [Candidatus Agathobaculum intestinigallinarum]